ncbi:MAG: 4Fe-4S binding protein [Anaerolineaceae bacterium]|nr:4Fe-4S binding protein [Anaerolineaceae bacterium]
MTARVDLLQRAPRLKRMLKSRLFQPALQLVTLFFFTVAILTGLVGTSAGSHNFGIVFVWIVWWALLIIILVPVTGRFWCTVCPIPAPGEWLQRRGIVRKTPGKLRTLHKRWPKRLKNMWLQNFGFLTVASFSAIILTRPQISAWVLLALILAAVALSVLYDNRVFCRYVCPVGGFIGLYSMLSPLELRVLDCKTCQDHTAKDCVVGNERGYGCPWLVYPGKLERNTYCGLCFECLKTCPKDNITLNWRPVGTDLTVGKEHRLDEAYKAFIMLGCALMYSAVLLGPWGWLKSWANLDTLAHWVLYTAGLWAVNLLVLPGLFGLVALIARKITGGQISRREIFVAYTYTLVPLGLAAWIAFSIGFVFTNGSYALAVISDPFGWGWNLFGTANTQWAPLGANLVGLLQTGVLTAGLLFAVQTAYRIARQQTSDYNRAFMAVLPVTSFLTVMTLGFLWLYLG